MVAAPHTKHQNNVHKCVRWPAKKVSHHLNVSGPYDFPFIKVKERR
jgi:hypothetical protein